MATKFHAFSFPAAATQADIRKSCKAVWGTAVTVKDIQYSNGKWWGTVTHRKSKISAVKVRIDYFINYMRIPAAIKKGEHGNMVTRRSEASPIVKEKATK